MQWRDTLERSEGGREGEKERERESWSQEEEKECSVDVIPRAD